LTLKTLPDADGLLSGVDVDVPSAAAVVFAVMVEMFARLGAAMLASKYHRHYYGLS